MNVRHLLFREILYRKGNFLLALAAVIAAVGCLVAELTILHAHDKSTTKLLEDKEKETKTKLQEARRVTEKRLGKEIAALKDRRAQHEAETAKLLGDFEAATAKRMKKLEDDYRKITKKLGFNIIIVPKKQNLIEMQALGYATEYMPEKYADKLAKSKIMTINHLLPVVQEMVKWKERERRILLTGVRGEVPFVHRNPKKPLIQPVPKKSMVVGYELHRNLKLKKGDKVKFQGREFTVHLVHPERGNKDDITIWINLDEAQEILGKKGQINLIMALECNCATIDRIAEIRKDIRNVLPDTHVLEFQSKAVARAEARKRANAEAQAMLKQKRRETTETQKRLAKETAAAIAQKEQDAAAVLEDVKTSGERELARARNARAAVRSQIVGIAMFLIPLALLGAIVWLALMTLSNVHQRRDEIGILRALGLSAAGVYALFVGRAALIGLLGGIVGCVLGVAVARLASGPPGFDAAVLLNPLLLIPVLAASPLLCALVGWLGATIASRQDPAVILQNA